MEVLMSFSINSNIGALKAYNALAKVNAQTEKAQFRLATTKRINSVADDTSGYNVGKKLESQTLTQKAQLTNLSSAKNYVSTAESALQQVNDKLNTIKAKLVDADDPLKSKASLSEDIKTLASEIKSILESTKINDSFILTKDGAIANAVETQDFNVGGAAFEFDLESKLAIDGIAESITELSALSGESTIADFRTADTKLNVALGSVQDALGYIGNQTQVLDSREEYLTAAIANNSAAIANLFDADMAMEQLNATKGQLGAQIASAMLSQANAAPSQIMSLFR